MSHLPTDAKKRKEYPLFTGLLKYFPDALAEVSRLSFVGNQQHNPGQPLHWAREKSTDQEDTLMRHLLESGTLDSDGVRHSTKVAWRALAKLQLELEAARKERAELADPPSLQATNLAALNRAMSQADGHAIPVTDYELEAWKQRSMKFNGNGDING